MVCSCKLYKNTFFNKINIPSSPAVLFDNFEPAYEEELKITQNRYLTKIRVNHEFNDICDIDYVVIEGTGGSFNYSFYTVEDIQMLSENVAELTLMTDPYNSCGGLNYGDGYCQLIPVYMVASRMHVTDDTFGKYTLPEDFTPNEPLQIEISNKIGDDNVGKNEVILSTLIMNPAQPNIADSLIPTSQTENNEVLLIPQTEEVPYNTDYQIGNTSTGKNLGCLILITNDTNKMINKLRAFGVENSIIASYVIPRYYCTYTGSTKYQMNMLSSIKGINSVINVSGITINQNCVNKKCNIGEYNKVVLASNCSGESCEALLEDITTGQALQVRIVADMRVDGKPTASFANYKGLQNEQYQMQAVNGMGWANAPLLYTEKSGGNVDRLNLMTNKRVENAKFRDEYYSQLGQGAFSGVAGLVQLATGNVAGGIGSLAESFGTFYGADKMKQDYERKTNAEMEIFNRNQTYQQPQINFARSGSVRDAYGNCFYIIKYKLSNTDLEQYDNYLTQFGYNVGNKQIQASDLFTREHYNYIKCNFVQLSSANIPMFLREQLETLLKNGVRLWHTPIRSEYMVAGGNNIRSSILEKQKEEK